MGAGLPRQAHTPVQRDALATRHLVAGQRHGGLINLIETNNQVDGAPVRRTAAPNFLAAVLQGDPKSLPRVPGDLAGKVVRVIGDGIFRSGGMSITAASFYPVRDGCF